MKLTHPLRIMALLACAALLSACALGGSDTRYRLMAPQVAADFQEPPIDDLILAVSRPHADRSRDTNKILVRRGRDLMPWPAAAWIDRAPEMVRGLLVEAFDGQLATVVRRGTVPADFRLALELRRFELVEQPGGLAAELVISARLLDLSGELLAVRHIDERGQLVADGSLDAAVGALEQALAQAFVTLAEWLRAELPAKEN